MADSKMFEYDKHYRECHKLNHPFVKARKNPTGDSYLVQLDLITRDYNLAIDCQNNIRKLIENEIGQMESTAKKSVFKGYNIDKELVWCDGILPKRLDAFCENLFDLSEKSQT